MAPSEEDAWLVEDGHILSELEDHGWQLTERGVAFTIADLTYDNGVMSVTVGHEILKSELLITFSTNDGDARVLVDLHEEPARALALLTSWQSRINADNFRDFVEEILKDYPDTFAVTEHSKKQIHPRSTRDTGK